MGTQIQKTTRSARAELSAVRTVSAAESTAPTSGEGVDVQEWDQILAVLGGDANGALTVQPWLRYAKFDKGAGRADLWVPQDETSGVPVAGYTAGMTSAGKLIINTYTADRVHVLITGMDGPTNAYVKYYGLVAKGGASAVSTSGGGASSDRVQGKAAVGAPTDGDPVYIGGIANAADRADVAEDAVVAASMDLAGYIRVLSKAYDALSGANKAAPTLTDADRFLDSEQFIDTTNVAAGTNNYPDDDGLAMEEFNHLVVHLEVSGGVTVTVEATLDDAALPDWVNVSRWGLSALTGATGAASFVDVSDIIDFEGINVQKVRLQIVTADSLNAVQAYIRRRFS